MSTDRLRDALARRAADPPVSEGTIRSYVSYARAALGAEHLNGAGGYALVDVDVDWTTFQDLVVGAEHTPEQAVELFGQAVGLVRGPPFADGSRWAEREGLPTIIETARQPSGTLRVMKNPFVGCDYLPGRELSILVAPPLLDNPVEVSRSQWKYRHNQLAP